MGKTRLLFKKIRDIKGTFHAMMRSIKDRNGMELTVAENIKKRWLDYIEELWTEFHNIVQQVVIKAIHKEKEMQKGKMVV